MLISYGCDLNSTGGKLDQSLLKKQIKQLVTVKYYAV